MSGRIAVEQSGATRLITIDRPESLNAIHRDMADALGTALQDADEHVDTRAVILTGRGRAFCAGADLRSLCRGDSVDPSVAEWGFAGFTRQNLHTPVVAAVNGLAYGGGAEIVLACDLAVMGSDAFLCFPEVSHGLVATGGGTMRLERHVGPKLAAELLLTAEKIPAARAARFGLVNTVVDRSEVMTVARALAARIARYDRFSVQATREAMAWSRGDRAAWHDDAWRRTLELKDEVLARHQAQSATSGSVWSDGSSS